jgi:hypothetical protein
LPVGEIVLGLFSYLGSYIVIMTNIGVRIGLLGGDGSVTYGPLSYTGATTGYAAGFDRFVYVGVSNVGSGNAGVIRLDLSNLDEAGRAAWAADLDTGETGAVDGVCTLGCTGRVVVGVNSQGIYEQHPTELVSSGFLYTGRVRYNTLENKSFRLMNVRRSELLGSVTVSSVTSEGTESTLYVYTSGSANQEFQVRPSSPVEYLSFKIELSRESTDATKGPEVSGWQVKALPAVPRKQQWRLPLLVFDQEQDRFGNKAGAVQSGLQRFQSLRNALLTGEPVTLQDLVYREQWTVLIEDLQFIQTSPPRNASGFGGVLVVTCREL